MYINILAVILLVIATITIYNGYYWVKQSKKDERSVIPGCVLLVMGGLLIGIVYFAI
jgi:hypothetical protein